MRSPWGSEDLTLCIQVLTQSLQGIQFSIDSLSKRIAARTQEEPSAKALTLLPSIGPLTATTLVVELGDLSRFRDYKAR